MAYKDEEEKRRKAQERKAAGQQYQEKRDELLKKNAELNASKKATPKPSTTAMASGKSKTSMTSERVSTSVAGYAKKNEGDNDMSRVVAGHNKENPDINNMTYEQAMGFATRIVYDDERDAFLSRWQKSAKKKNGGAPTMDEMRTYLNSQKPGGLYRESKDSYSKQVKENFKNDYTNIKTMHTFDGLLDISGNAVNMNTASLEEIERAIRFTANDKKRKALVSALETLTKTPGNRFYGVTFDKSNTGEFLESSELTNKNYNDKMEYFRGQFDPIAGAGEANTSVYQELLKGIEESGKSDYVKRQFKDALDEVYTELIGGELPKPQASNAPQEPQNAPETAETPVAEQEPMPKGGAVWNTNGEAYTIVDGKAVKVTPDAAPEPIAPSAPSLQDALKDEKFKQRYLERLLEKEGKEAADFTKETLDSMVQKGVDSGDFAEFVIGQMAASSVQVASASPVRGVFKGKEKKETFGPERPTIQQENEHSLSQALRDEAFYGEYMSAVEAKNEIPYGSIDLSHDPIKAASYVAAGEVRQLTKETQDALAEIASESPGWRAVIGVTIDPTQDQLQSAQDGDAHARAFVDATRDYWATGDTNAILGSTLTSYLNLSKSDRFPPSLRDDMQGAIAELAYRAEQAYKNGEFSYDPAKETLYDAYTKLNPASMQLVRGVKKQVHDMYLERKQAEKLAYDEAVKNEQELLKEHREQVASGNYTQEAYDHVLMEAPQVTTQSARSDATYNAMFQEIAMDRTLSDGMEDSWYNQMAEVYLRENGLPDDLFSVAAMQYKDTLAAFEKDLLLSDMRVAATLDYADLGSMYEKWGGMDVDKLHERAEIALKQMSANVKDEDIAALSQQNLYTGTGEEVGNVEAFGIGTAHGVLDTSGEMLEGIWAFSSMSKEDSVAAVYKVRQDWSKRYGVAFGTDMYKHAMYEYCDLIPEEHGKAIREYLDAGYDPFRLGIDPTNESIILETSKKLDGRAKAIQKWAFGALDAKQGKVFEVGSATGSTLTMQTVATVTQLGTHNPLIGSLVGYGLVSGNQQIKEELANGATRKEAKTMGYLRAWSDSVANMLSSDKFTEKLRGFVGFGPLVAKGLDAAGDIASARGSLGMIKRYGNIVGKAIKGAGEQILEETVVDPMLEGTTWQIAEAGGRAYLGGAGFIQSVFNGLANIDVMESVDSTVKDAGVNFISTLPLAIIGGLGDGFKASRVAATKLMATGEADAAQAFVEAAVSDLEVPENRDTLNAALHDAAVGEEAAVIAMTDDENGGKDIDVATKAQEQADAHAKSEENSMAAAEAGRVATLAAQERINNGEINPELVTQIGNGVAAHTKNSQSTIEHRREKEQKQAEADAAFAEGMKKATAKAEAEVSAREEAIAQETATNGRLGQIDARLKEIEGEYTAMLEGDPDANMPPEMQQEIFDLENEREEIFANQTREEPPKVDEKAVSEQKAEVEATFAKKDAEANAYMEAETEREKAQQEADEMKPVYQSLKSTQVYVDETQKANILSRTGLKSLPQVNRKFGLKLTDKQGTDVISLDGSFFSELADLAPGRIAQDVTVAEDALMDIVERKKQLKGMQASVGETAYEKYLPDGTFFNIKDPVMQQLTSDVKKATGVDIVVAPLVGNVRALYDRAEKRIVINNRIGAGEISKKVVMHELTHYLEGGEGYAKYKEAVLKAAYAHDADGKLRKADKERILSTYAKADMALDEAGLESELVAEATEKIITDPDGYLTRQLLGQKQKGLLYNLAMKLRQFLARKKAQKAGNLDQYEMIQTAYERLREAIMQGGGDSQNADPTVDLDSAGRRRDEMAGVGEGGQMQFSLAPNQFANKTAQELLSIDDSVKDVLMGSNHEIIGNDERLEKAWEAVNARGADTVADELLSLPKKSWGAQENVNAALCAVLANRNGDTVTAATILTRYDREGTVQGQALQARQLIKRLSPEGAMLEMIRKADNANKKRGIPAGSFPTGEDAPKKGAEKKREDGSVERVAAPVQEVYHEADELKKELDKLPTDVSYDNPWNLPLSEKMMALIREFGLMGEKLPGIHYNLATKKQRMLAAILAMDPAVEGDGLKTLCQQLKAIDKGYAVVTVADLRYVSSQMMEFRAKEGPDATIPQTEEGAHALGRAYQALDNVQTADFLKQWSALRFANMLSAPATAVRNIAGNVIGGGMEDIAVRVADAIGVDERVSKKTGTRTTAVATREERKAANDAFRKEVVHTVMDYAVDKVDTSYGRKYDVGGKGRVFQPEFLEMYRNMVDFAMQIGDRPFFEQKYAEEMAIIKRLGMKKTEMDDDGAVVTRPMTEQEMHEEATMRALRRVFQEDNLIVEWVNSLRYKNPLADIAVTTLMPFIRTPTNVAIRAIEYSPVGLGLAVGRKMLLGIDSGKAGSISQRDYVMGIGRGLTGTGLAVAGWALASAGIIKFGREEEENKGRQEAQKAKNVPYGMYIQIGDTMREIDWAMPVASAIAIGADFHKALKDGSGIADAALGAVHSSVSGQIFDTPMMSAMNDIFRGYDSSENVITRYLSTGAESLLNQTFSPSIIRAFAKATDPYVRDTGTNNSLFTSINKNVIQYWPGLRQMLPKATDITGDYALQGGYYGWNKETQNAALHFLDSFFTPTATIGEKNDDALYELVDLSYRTRETAFLPTTIVSSNGKLTINKSLAEAAGMGEAAYDMHLTADERREFNRLYSDLLFNGMRGAKYETADGFTKRHKKVVNGDYLKNGIRKMMESGEWDRMTDDEKMDVVSAMKSAAKELVSYLAIKGEL